MSKYLVTGAAGFIGSHVCRRLVDDGHDVTGIDNFNASYGLAPARWRAANMIAAVPIGEENLTYGFGIDPEIDAVIHLAAWAGTPRSFEEPHKYVCNNITATLNVLEACRYAKISRLVMISSSSVYSCGESEGSEPSPYAVTKQTCEQMCAAYRHKYGMDIVILRPFTVYGPAGRPDMSVMRFLRALAYGEPMQIDGDGSQTRQWTYVGDVVDAVLSVLKPYPSNAQRTIDVAGPEVATVNTVAGILAAHCGNEFHVSYKRGCFWPDGPTATLNLIVPRATRADKMPLAEGLRKTADWFREHWEAGDLAGWF